MRSATVRRLTTESSGRDNLNTKKQDVSNYLHHLRKMQEQKISFLHESDPNMPDGSTVDPNQDMGAVDPAAMTTDVSQEATEDIQKGSITMEMVIDKFNAIRAGRSFKDKAIKQQMMTYFEKLSDDEKVALYAFMKGISQIVSGEFTGYSPVSPSDVGAPAAAPGVPAEPGAEAPPAEGSAPPPPVEEPTPGPTPPNPANAETPPAPEVPPPPAPPAPPPVPTKKVIKTIKPNIIRRQPAPSNPQMGMDSAPIPITAKVR